MLIYYSLTFKRYWGHFGRLDFYIILPSFMLLLSKIYIYTRGYNGNNKIHIRIYPKRLFLPNVSAYKHANAQGYLYAQELYGRRNYTYSNIRPSGFNLEWIYERQRISLFGMKHCIIIACFSPNSLWRSRYFIRACVILFLKKKCQVHDNFF